MNCKLVIVTHHYVHDVKDQESSRIGAYNISISDFIKRIDYFSEKYSIIAPDLFISHIKYKTPLPDNAMLLTFDDGYIDHYECVYPVLKERGLKAFFFPSTKPLFEKKMLNTNKLQLIFDTKDKELLYAELLKAARNVCSGSVLKLFENIGYLDDFNEKDNSFSEYLEWGVPISCSNYIIDRLFKRFIHSSEKELCKAYYMSFDQLLDMKENGMHIGCHGYSHYCMKFISEKVKLDEINKSIMLMKQINGRKSDWVMSYPYGAYDRGLVSIIKNRGCIAGLTTVDRISDLAADDIYTLPRVDVTSTRL